MIRKDTTQKTKDWETQDPLKYGDEKGALENSASTYHVTFYYFEEKIWIIEIKISFFFHTNFNLFWTEIYHIIHK